MKKKNHQNPQQRTNTLKNIESADGASNIKIQNLGKSFDQLAKNSTTTRKLVIVRPLNGPAAPQSVHFGVWPSTLPPLKASPSKEKIKELRVYQPHLAYLPLLLGPKEAKEQE